MSFEAIRQRRSPQRSKWERHRAIRPQVECLFPIAVLPFPPITTGIKMSIINPIPGVRYKVRVGLPPWPVDLAPLPPRTLLVGLIPTAMPYPVTLGDPMGLIELVWGEETLVRIMEDTIEIGRFIYAPAPDHPSPIVLRFVDIVEEVLPPPEEAAASLLAFLQAMTSAHVEHVGTDPIIVVESDCPLNAGDPPCVPTYWQGYRVDFRLTAGE